MKINTNGLSTHEMFGYKTEDDMYKNITDLDYAFENKKEIALITAMLKLQSMGTEPTMLLMTVISTLTGLDICGPGDLFDYFNKSLKEDDVIVMCARIVKIGDEDYKAREKEAIKMLKAMRGID